MSWQERVAEKGLGDFPPEGIPTEEAMHRFEARRLPSLPHVRGGAALLQGLARTARDRGRPWIGSPDGEDLQINFKPPWSVHQLGGAARCVRARARQVAGARSRSARGIWGFESENPRILDR